MTVPVVFPDLRGMYKWQSHELIAAAKAAVGKDVASDDDIFNFLNRVYYELRNLGVAPQERALNFAATNAYQTNIAFAESAGRNLALDSITVAKSPICRPDSDCWDVQLLMFDPENERRASRVYRYTVDVSDVLPVTVGTVRSWAVRTGALCEATADCRHSYPRERARLDVTRPRWSNFGVEMALQRKSDDQ